MNSLTEIVNYGSRKIHSKVRNGTRKYVPTNLEGCKLYLPMEQKIFNLSADHSGLNNHGTIYGATETDGKINKGLYFDGVDDYVDCGNVIDVTNKLTVIAWVKFPSDCYGPVVSKYESGDLRWHLWIDGNSRIICNIANKAARVSITGLIDTWVHLGMIYDGEQESQEDRLKLLINGEKITLDFYYGTIPSSCPTINSNLYINKQSTYYGKMSIDELRVYNVAISEETVIASYQQEL